MRVEYRSSPVLNLFGIIVAVLTVAGIVFVMLCHC
jgi:hypothetical protein